MFNVKRLISIVLVLVFAFTVVGCGSKTVAVVNGEKIPKTELDKMVGMKKVALEQQGASFAGQQGEMMMKAIEQQTLEEIIQQKILLQAAKKEGLVPTKAEIKKELENIKAQFGGEKTFNETLKQFKYTQKDIEDKLAFDLAYTKLFDKVTGDIKVNEQEVKDYYEKNKAVIKEPVKIKARAILIKFDDANQQSMGQPPAKVGRTEAEAEKLAKDMIKELNNGTSFEKLAEEKSEDTRFKADGGLVKNAENKSPYELGTVMPPEFDQAAQELKAGKYSEKPVKTAQGFYIIKLEELTPEKQLTFDEAKAKILQELPMIRKQEKFNQYFTNLEEEAKIDNKLAKEAAKAGNNGSAGTADGGGQSSGNSGQLPAGHP